MIGFALCGSFCTVRRALSEMERLASHYEVQGIVSETVYTTDTRFARAQNVLEDIVQNIPAPSGDPKAPLKALIFDSQYDPYRGVIVYFRVMEGTVRTGM